MPRTATGSWAAAAATEQTMAAVNSPMLGIIMPPEYAARWPNTTEPRSAASAGYVLVAGLHPV